VTKHEYDSKNLSGAFSKRSHVGCLVMFFFLKPHMLVCIMLTDREKFFNFVRDACGNTFKVSIDKALGHLSKSGKVKDEDIRDLFYGDFANPDGDHAYDEISDMKSLMHVMEQ
jgi:hypothetical protein